ncbi:MAG TPA: diguanylate cyclase [Sulfuricurvum sp.]|nr:diguanylate cyclase [Sulfuricurvum sp.]
MFKLLETGQTKEFLNAAEFIFMSLSYVLLLYFTLRVIWNRALARKLLILLIGSLIVMTGFDLLSFENANILVRYLLGAPAIFLTAYVFAHPFYLVQGSAYTSIKKCAYILSATFFTYGILAGLIVPAGTFFPASVLNTDTFYSITGLPVQFFRALCAIVAIYAMSQILRLFKHDTDFHLLKLSKALEESGDTVVITNIEGKIEYVNRAFEEQSGFLAQEVIGKNPNILRSGEHHNTFYEQLWQTILSGETYRGVVTNKRKDTTFYHEFKTIVPLKNKRGKLSNFISTGKDITSRVSFEHELEKAAATDPLTGAANRLQCDKWLKSATEQARIFNTPIALILFDIDDFKKVNDTFGHNAGDNVLIQIAKIVHTMVRNSDVFARWGGEEFIILQIDTPFEGTISFAERLRKEIESSMFKDIGPITISLGVAKYDGTESIESFIKKADDAMYEAKEQGKNKVVVDRG